MTPFSKDKAFASILIVSNDSPLDDTLSSILKEEGYRVELAEISNEGMRKGSQNGYDLILLDLATQDTEPFPTLQSLTQECPHLHVVVTVTPNVPPEQRVELIKGGAFDLLTKPYQWHELKVVFQRALVVIRLRDHAEKISQSLHKSEKYFKSVVQASPDAMVLGGGRGAILSWNEAAQNMFGYTSEEIIGQPLTRLMPSRYHQAHQEGLARVSSTHQTKVIGHTVELEALRRDGSEFPIELSLSYSHVEDKIFYCGIIRDITERKRGEKQTNELAMRNTLLLKSAGEGIYGLDLEGKTIFVNPAGAEMLGYTSEELIGVPMHSTMHHTKSDGLPYPQEECPMYAAFRDGAVHHREDEVFWRKDGSSFPVEYTSTPIKDQNGKLTGAVVTFSDITERKQTELALLERNRVLALDAEVGQIISRNQELYPLLWSCAEALVHHLDAALARIWILETTEQVLTLKASAGLYTHVNGPHSRIPVGHLKVGQIAAEKKPLLTNSVIGDPRIPDQEWAKREGLVAFAGYPLLRGQDVVGVMGLFSKHPLTSFTLKSLEMVADRITTAIEFQRATEVNHTLARFNEQILASAGEGIFGVSPQGTITFVNPAGANMLGYHLDEMQELAIHATIHPANRDGAPCLIDGCSMLTVFKDGVLQHDDREVFCRKNGTSFPVAYTATPMWEDGQVIGAVVIFKDISLQKLAEEAQERFCQQIGATLAALPGSILVVDKAQQVLYANPRAQQNFGQDHSSLVRCPIHKVLPFTSAEWNRLEEEFSRRGNEVEENLQDLEFEIRDRTYAYCLFPISLEGWEVSETGIVIWDMTERKKLQDQLIQSEKLSSLGTLVSGMVHEVRSPMQSIVGYTDLILQEENLQTIQEFAGDLKRVSAHINTVLTEFMTYARPSAHEPSSDVNLNDRLSEALKMVQRGPTFGTVEVEQQFSSLPSVSVRQGEIDQVLINLMGNAVQAMDGKGRLTLATFHKDHCVTAQISDTGCGMPKEILNQIFDPFFSTKGKGKGTGLGLSIVQQIVKRCGGQISVESEVGKGTTFTIQLPGSSQACGDRESS